MWKTVYLRSNPRHNNNYEITINFHSWPATYKDCPEFYWGVNMIVIPPNSKTFSDWRRKCHGSKLTNSLGRTKLTNSLRKQQLELSTCTWWGRAPWNGGKFVCCSSRCEKAIEVGQHFSLEKAFIIQEKWFIVAMDKSISKRKIWTFCVLKLLIWPQKWLTVFGNSPFDRYHHLQGRKIVVSFTTNYAQSNPE